MALKVVVTEECTGCSRGQASSRWVIGMCEAEGGAHRRRRVWAIPVSGQPTCSIRSPFLSFPPLVTSVTRTYLCARASPSAPSAACGPRCALGRARSLGPQTIRVLALTR